MGNKKLPPYMRMTMHEFRSQKRKELREARRALHALRMGCAFMPEGRLVTSAIEKIDEAIEQCKVKNWGQ